MIRVRQEVYPSWGYWRASHSFKPSKPMKEFCGVCWGQGKIFEPSEYGLIAIVCEACRFHR